MRRSRPGRWGMLKRVADRTYNCLSIDAEGSTKHGRAARGGAAGGAALRSDDAAGSRQRCSRSARPGASTREGRGATGSCSSRSRGLRARRRRNAPRGDRELDAREDGGLRRRRTGVGSCNARARPDRVARRRRAEGRRRHRLREGAVRRPAARKRAKLCTKATSSIAVDLGLRKHASRLFTCDLTYDYVKISAVTT